MREPERWARPKRYTLLARPTVEVPYRPMGIVSSAGSAQGMLPAHSSSSPMARSVY